MELLNALVVFLNFVLIPAAAYGAQLALGALGVTLIYGILRFSNFAHGDTMAFGTALTILATWGLQSLGISLGPVPVALLALPACENPQLNVGASVGSGGVSVYPSVSGRVGGVGVAVTP